MQRWFKCAIVTDKDLELMQEAPEDAAEFAQCTFESEWRPRLSLANQVGVRKALGEEGETICRARSEDRSLPRDEGGRMTNICQQRSEIIRALVDREIAYLDPEPGSNFPQRHPLTPGMPLWFSDDPADANRATAGKIELEYRDLVNFRLYRAIAVCAVAVVALINFFAWMNS